MTGNCGNPDHSVPERTHSMHVEEETNLDRIKAHRNTDVITDFYRFNIDIFKKSV